MTQKMIIDLTSGLRFLTQKIQNPKMRRFFLLIHFSMTQTVWWVDWFFFFFVSNN